MYSKPLYEILFFDSIIFLKFLFESYFNLLFKSSSVNYFPIKFKFSNYKCPFSCEFTSSNLFLEFVYRVSMKFKKFYEATDFLYCEFLWSKKLCDFLGYNYYGISGVTFLLKLFLQGEIFGDYNI